MRGGGSTCGDKDESGISGDADGEGRLTNAVPNVVGTCDQSREGLG